MCRFEPEKNAPFRRLIAVNATLDLLNHKKIIDGGRNLSMLTPHTYTHVTFAKLSRLLYGINVMTLRKWFVQIERPKIIHGFLK